MELAERELRRTRSEIERDREEGSGDSMPEELHPPRHDRLRSGLLEVLGEQARREGQTADALAYLRRAARLQPVETEAQELGGLALPTTWIVDPSGVIRMRPRGYDPEHADSWVERALAHLETVASDSGSRSEPTSTDTR